MYQSHTHGTAKKIIGIIDLGSNSARLLIVRLLPGGAYTILNRVKHMVRLGENSFQEKMLQEAAMQRTLTVLRSFMHMCRTYGVEEMLPMATAAMRDATNAHEFIRLVREKVGIELMVISGKEEARLIYLGVSSGLPMSLSLRAYIDIGGGSTELAVASATGYEVLDSLNIGCVRVTNQFLENHDGRISKSVFADMCQHVRSKGAYAIARVRTFAVAELIGSSGTALALHAIAYRLEHGVSPNDEQVVSTPLTLHALRKTASYICNLTGEERRALPGISTRRAEVLPAGAAILLTLMEELQMSRMFVSTRNLQDGILIDYLRRMQQEPTPMRSVREQSVLQLAHRCQFEEQHAYYVARIALQLHDSAVDCGIIRLDHQARELLYYAALLHDIGIFIAYTKHASHGAYLIKNTALLGFNDAEISFLAQLTQWHNSKNAKKIEEMEMQRAQLHEHTMLFALFLSLAENMDRLHCQHIHEASFSRKAGHVTLTIVNKGASPVELDAVLGMQKVLKRRLGEGAQISVESLV